MIIGFAGRMRSGKTELAKICEDAGFEKLYFALPLKQLCADLMDISIDELNKLKNNGTDIGLTIGKDLCTIMSEETDIPYDVIFEKCNGKLINNVRELLQFVGTDLIREYNTNWHVNKIREMINPKHNYVIDDVRFKNELDLVRELGGDCWFVIRPKIDNVSNHESEISLTWRDFGNKIIINDAGLELFKFRWIMFFSNYAKSIETREKCLKTDNIVSLYGEMSEPLCVLDLLEVSPHLFTYEDREFNCNDIAKITQEENNNLDIEYKDGTHEIVQNPINIENLKVCINNN